MQTNTLNFGINRGQASGKPSSSTPPVVGALAEDDGVSLLAEDDGITVLTED